MNMLSNWGDHQGNQAPAKFCPSDERWRKVEGEGAPRSFLEEVIL